MLTRNGHVIMQCIPVSDWNSLWLKVNGEIVFRCDIRDLDFGGDGLLDPLCHKALRAVNNAFWWRPQNRYHRANAQFMEFSTENDLFH